MKTPTNHEPVLEMVTAELMRTACPNCTWASSITTDINRALLEGNAHHTVTWAYRASVAHYKDRLRTAGRGSANRAGDWNK